MHIKVLALISAFSFLVGCDDDPHRHRAPLGPYLTSFGLFDSFGYDSNRGNRALHLDPYVAEGVFEVYWYVDSDVDYRVTVSVNDAPDAFGAVRLSSEICGPFRSCFRSGMHVCEYTADSYMGCGVDWHEVDRNFRSVDHLFRAYPDILYVNLEMCDLGGRSCVVDSLRVTAH